MAKPRGCAIERLFYFRYQASLILSISVLACKGCPSVPLQYIFSASRGPLQRYPNTSVGPKRIFRVSERLKAQGCSFREANTPREATSPREITACTRRLPGVSPMGIAPHGRHAAVTNAPHCCLAEAGGGRTRCSEAVSRPKPATTRALPSALIGRGAGLVRGQFASTAPYKSLAARLGASRSNSRLRSSNWRS
jgi:hypothetical protein